MISYENLKALQTLYKSKLLGIKYVDDIVLQSPDIPPENTMTTPSDLPLLRTTVSSCHLCGLSKSRKIVQTGVGNTSARLMIIADIPTIAENNEGPMQGKSAKKLQEMLTFIELTAKDVYYTHMVKCLPLPGQQPSPQELTTCKPYVQREIELVQPKLIVTLGQLSYNYLTNDSTAYHSVVGELQSYHGYTHISIYSPTFLLRNPSFETEMVNYMKKIQGFLCEN